MNMTENNNESHLQEDVMLPSKEKPKSIMKKIADKLTSNGTFDMSKSVQSANATYLMTKYGHAYDSIERLDTFLKELSSTISEKCSRGEYACVKKLPLDLAEFKAGIISLFKNKGYSVADLKDHIENVTCDYIFVCWDKFDPSREKDQPQQSNNH